MPKKTVLHPIHLAHNAVMLDFAGWEMPLHYGSQIEEHHHVRQNAGIFDVSHMGIIDIQGRDAKAALQYLLTNNVEKLTEPGQALYTCLLNTAGGVLDDLMVYYIAPEVYRLVVNAATTEKDLAWITQNSANFSIEIVPKRHLAMMAVQGPEARQKVGRAFPVLNEPIQALRPFHFFQHGEYFIARTGYTGEDGLEVIVPNEEANPFWSLCEQEGVFPCGLGARDTLRLEAGFNLYGQDMDESVTPLESNLAWTVAFEPSNRLFIGRDACEKAKAEGFLPKLIGLILLQKGVCRRHQAVLVDGVKVGEVTSGSFSPTLKQAIALARVSEVSAEYSVDIRGKSHPAKVTPLPFVRGAKK